MSKNKRKAIKGSEKKKSLFKIILKYSFKVIIFGIGFIMLFAILIYIGLFGKLPSKQELSTINNNVATEVYSANNVLMGKYYYQNRMIPYKNNISSNVLNALIATEDSRFFEHKGVDIVSMGRVIVRSLLLFDRSQGGGSTISQQLAKNLYSRKQYGNLSLLINKIKEIFIASRLEDIYTKKEILYLYLNTVPFGEGVYGIEAASLRFFNKHSSELNIPEAATIIGMLAANTAYNPRINPKKSLQRRNIVIKRMVSAGYVSEKRGVRLCETKINLDYKRFNHNTGIAPYFRDYVKKEAVKILKSEYGDRYNIYSDGLKIYTTIDETLQGYAEKAVFKHMSALQKEFKKHWRNRYPWKDKPYVFNNEMRKSERYKDFKALGLNEKQIKERMRKLTSMKIFAYPKPKRVNLSPLDSISHYLKILNAGFLVMNPHNGAVLAWVGGVNHKYFKLDHVTIKRQAGSTFKPFVYAAALEQGKSPCDFISNSRVTYKDYKNWSPSNSDNNHNGYYSLKGALANSVNTVTAKIIMDVGVENVVDLAHNMGIESQLPNVPAISLGAASMNLKELLTAYSCFCNRGEKVNSFTIKRIEDRNGKVLYMHQTSYDNNKVISVKTSQLINYMLNHAVEAGTGKNLINTYHLKSNIAGKTGTTQNNVDGWFIGYTPNLIAGAWVGADNPIVHFRTTALGQGAHTALPIFALFMSQVENNSKYRNFVKANFELLSKYQKKDIACVDFSENNPETSIFNIFKRSKKKDKHKNLLEHMKDLFR